MADVGVQDPQQDYYYDEWEDDGDPPPPQEYEREDNANAPLPRNYEWERTVDDGDPPLPHEYEQEYSEDDGYRSIPRNYHPEYEREESEDEYEDDGGLPLGRYTEDTYAPARAGYTPQPTTNAARGRYPHSHTSQCQPLVCYGDEISSKPNGPGRDDREYDQDWDEWEYDRGRDDRDYDRGRDDREYDWGRDDSEYGWEGAVDYPLPSRGHPTAREGRVSPRHPAPQPSRVGRYTWGSRAEDTLPRRDDGRRYKPQLMSAGYHPLPRNISFDGTGNWRAFYRKFEACAKEMNWSYAQRLNQLCWSLEGPASDFFDLVRGREPRLNYLEVAERLERRFDYRGPPESAQLEFSVARQGANEPLLDWADRVYELASRAFPGIQEAYVQRQMVLRLCQGCADREAGCHALDRHPNTMDEAVEAITWYQHSRRAVYGRPRQTKVIAVGATDEKEPRIRQVDKSPHRRPPCGRGTGPPSKLEHRVTHREGTPGELGENARNSCEESRPAHPAGRFPPARAGTQNTRDASTPYLL